MLSLSLIFNNIKRELKFNFAGSQLGLLWFLITPLIQTLIFYYIFEHVLKTRFPKEATANIPYAAYLIIGIAFWNGFLQGVSKGSIAILDNRHLIKKIPAPFYIYVVSSSTVGFMYTPIVLLYTIPLLKEEAIGIFLNLLPMILLWYFLCIGSSLILSSLAVYIRDLPYVISPMMNFLFYTVPIVYPYSFIPEKIRIFININPFFHMVKCIYLQASGEATFTTFITCFGISMISLLIGIFTYTKLRQGFLDVL